MDRKTWTYLLCGGLALIAVVFAAGIYTGSRAGRSSVNIEYENRLAAITSINADLQNQNKQLAGLNQSLTERLNDVTGRLTKAENIIGELDLRTSTDTDTVQRIIDNLEKLDRAVQALIMVR